MRISCRAVIFKDDEITIMHRIKKDDNGNYSEYYTFPGGGVEENEDNETCIKREVLEEFGINVKPIKLIYEYHGYNSVQYFYLCEWIDGIFGSGKGPEMINYIEKKGHYIPTLQKIKEINKINLQPTSITNQLINDIQNNNLINNNEVIIINDK
jgi:ADP-ribose pyrophosphatase YjhB (NUDIX family)